MSSSPNPLLPAFPTSEKDFGLSIRDYFTAAALTGIMARTDLPPEKASALAVQVADDTIKTLRETDPLRV